MSANNQLAEPVLLGDGSVAPPGVTIILGMTWKVLLGQKLGAMAVQAAVLAKASHYTHTPNIGSVGYTNLKPGVKTTYISAAGIVASQKTMGDFLIGLALNETDTWLCGVSNGSVVSGYDIVVNDALTFEKIVNAFKVRFEEAHLIGDVELGFAAEYGWDAISEGLASKEFRKNATIRPTSKGLSERFEAVPKKVLYIGGIALILLVGQRFIVPAISNVFHKPKEIAVIDPSEAWKDALDEWVRAHPVSSQGSLNELLDALANQPLVVAGWQASAFDCVWGQKSWQCTTKYSASKRSHTNQAFEAAKPKDWITTFTPMRDVQVRYDIAASAVKLDVKSLKPVADYELITMSQLQQITPLIADSAAPMGTFVKVPVPEPKTNEGQPIALPADMLIPKVSMLKIIAPLRDIAAFQTWINDVAWTNVSLRIERGKQPSAKDSAITMELKGNFYAKN
ncbi:hypothetical protein [Polaromonas naphthalenivorans]|uniref:Pilin accessory protein (PilO) n=1 Tax=Polaromonas naphthalenivorans (strain CJ2) TaxID=365044 RepID=A1VV38_POLNA|nr:hypothetical protein [Polaromonas naphthalenivorans]ABM39516.1 hypothetical protein Pnap_4233 [Polaromonas naphthalenivorans CJ2]